MQPKLNLAAFIALAQHEVQKALEYLAQPEVRVQSPEAPSQIFATVGTVRMSVPLRYVVWPEPPHPVLPVTPIDAPQPMQAPPPAPGIQPVDAAQDPGAILAPGMPWPPGGQPVVRYHLNVSTVGGCAEEGGCGATGKIEIEFITCLKQ